MFILLYKLIIVSCFLLMFFFPFRVRHAVDAFAGLVFCHRHTLRFRGFALVVRPDGESWEVVELQAGTTP